MLYETFNSVRTLLSGITALKSVQWYNAQYEGTIYVSPVSFIEFPDRIPFEPIAGTICRADFALRIHIVSVVTAGQDSSIPDNLIQEHEAIAEQTMALLQGKQLQMKENRTTSLSPTGWQHWHKYKGWMVTFVDFKATAILE